MGLRLANYGAAVRSAGLKHGALPGWVLVDGSAQSMRVPFPIWKVMFAEISVSARSRSLNALPRFVMRVLKAVVVVPGVLTTVSMRVRAVRTRFAWATFRLGAPE